MSLINRKGGGLRPRALQASTNIINAQSDIIGPQARATLINQLKPVDVLKPQSGIPRLKRLDENAILNREPPKSTLKESNLAPNKLNKKSDKEYKSPKKTIDENDPSDLKKVNSSEDDKCTTNGKHIVDENDLSTLIAGSYDPLKDVYGLDEDLYQRILKLELADDGLPTYKGEEIFDF